MALQQRIGENMNEIKQLFVDYIEGRVDTEEFISKIDSDAKYLLWFQKQIPEGKLGRYDRKRPDGSLYQVDGPYSIASMIESILIGPGTHLGRKMNLHYYISRLYQEIFPDENVKEDLTLDNKFDFLLDACPDYLFSMQIEDSGIFEKILNELPEGLSKTKRVKMFRDKLKEMFFIEGQKYPRWIQSSEWPLSKTGKPTKFLNQKNKGEITIYYFLDVDTNEKIEVVQAF